MEEEEAKRRVHAVWCAAWCHEDFAAARDKFRETYKTMSKDQAREYVKRWSTAFK